MPTLDVWNILGIISIIALIFAFTGKSSIWGGLTLGVTIGLIVAFVFVIKGESFQWVILKKGAIIGTLAGLVAELLGRISKSSKK